MRTKFLIENIRIYLLKLKKTFYFYQKVPQKCLIFGKISIWIKNWAVFFLIFNLNASWGKFAQLYERHFVRLAEKRRCPFPARQIRTIRSCWVCLVEISRERCAKSARKIDGRGCVPASGVVTIASHPLTGSHTLEHMKQRTFRANFQADSPRGFLHKLSYRTAFF